MAKSISQKSAQFIGVNCSIIFLTLTSFCFLSFKFSDPPSWGLASLYFWTLYYPEKVSLGAIFGIGILQDNSWGAPIGFFEFLNLVFWLFTFIYRKYLFQKGFLIGWLGFLIVYSVYLLAREVIAYEVLSKPFYFYKLLYEILFTLLSYPLIARGCFYLYQKIS
jgi:cell shape-determining protein MreD